MIDLKYSLFSLKAWVRFCLFNWHLHDWSSLQSNYEAYNIFDFIEKETKQNSRFYGLDES